MKIKWMLLGSLITLLIVVGIGGTYYVLTKESNEINYSPVPPPVQLPTPPLPSQTEPPLPPKTQTPPLFDQEKISSFSPVLKKRVYYLKNGDLWVADIARPQTHTNLLLDIHDEILTFDISHDQNLLAYAIKRNPSTPDDEFSQQYGDTIIVRNLSNSSEFELYSDKNAMDMQLRDIQFSPDDKKLFFSNNSILIANLATKNFQKYETLPKNSYCPIYFLDDVSRDGRYILATRACMEGASQIVFDVETGKVKGTFPGGYVEDATWALGFINKNSLFGYHYASEAPENSTLTFGVYDLFGKAMKEIKKTHDGRMFFNNKSKDSRILVGLPADTAPISLYELNPQTFFLSEISSKIDMVAILYHENFSFWLTNNDLENPLLVDSINEVDHDPRLKLR